MTKHKKGNKKLMVLAAFAASVAIGATVPGASTSISAFAEMMAGKGNYYSDFSSIEDLQKEAAKLGEELAEEGMTLLKNKDNALPLKGSERVNVFGVTSNDLIGGSENVVDVLEEAGFSVNKTLAKYYDETGASSSGGGGMMGPQTNNKIGKEKTEKDFPETVKSSMGLYDDLAVIVISRDGSEGSDLKMVTEEVEDNKYGDKAQGWEHRDLLRKDGKEYKHYLQLTDSEESLIQYAERVCKKVVVLLNTSNVIEVGNLENDDEIDGIVWMGRTGDNGLSAFAKILNGTLNPSSRTVDVFTADHTADPTWINYATGQQVDNVNSEYFVEQDGSGNKYRFYQKVEKDGKTEYVEYVRDSHGNIYRSGPDMFEGYSFSMYEEGIYMGYRYYETAYAEIANNNYAVYGEGDDVTYNKDTADRWYNESVVYPFGYGLSYTEFEWTNVTPASNVADWSSKKTIDLKVKVTNTGSMAGKDVVQVYAHAPYIDGEIEKSEVVLVGYAKTDVIQPGKSQTVTITVNVQDIASFDDYDKNKNGKTTYELDAGAGYELRFQSDSHTVKATQSLSDLAADVILDKDDFSGATVDALYSTSESEYNSLGYDPKTKKSMKEEGKYIELTRSDFAGTFPDAHTMDEMSRSDEWFAWMMGRDLYTADASISLSTKEADGKNEIWSVAEIGYAEDESDNPATEQQPWVQKASDFTGANGKYHGWTQAADAAAQDTTSATWLLLKDMRGIDPDSDTVISEGKFKGKTGRQAWEQFMNQLTWQELVIVVSNITEKALDSVDAPRTPANDSPKNLGSTYDWGDECHIAATWNTDLARQQGTIVGSISLLNNTGWYGPAMNTHRTAFGGRNNEYYSQDGYQAGMIAAAVVQGAQSKGCATYIKHFALNDQETGRVHSSAICTEQAAREIYFKAFQIAVQEGNSQHLMCSMGSLGDILIGTNYNVMQKMLKDEWGFTGMAATDAWNPQKDCWPIDLLVRCGMDAPLQDADKTGSGSYYTVDEATGKASSATYLVSGKWDAEKGTVVMNGKTSYTQWYCVRKAAQNILYANVNSNYIKNGIDLTAYSGESALTAAKQGVKYAGASVAASIDADTVTYSITSGVLPAGVSMASDGSLSGTPTTPGEYKFTVQLLAENYLKATKTFTLSVDSAFSTDSDMKALKVGEEVDAYIESDVIKLKEVDAENGYDTIEYTVTAGKLPEGVTLNSADGQFTGTPTEGGTFNVTVHVKATKKSSGGNQGGPGGPGGGGGMPDFGGGFPGGPGGGSSSSTTELDYNLTIVVAADETPVIEGVGTLRVDSGKLQYMNAEGTWVDVASLEHLAAGNAETIRVNEGKLQYNANGNWTDIASLETLAGSGEIANGSVRVEGGNIQYKNADGEWTNIAAIDSLGGAPAEEEKGGCNSAIGIGIGIPALMITAAAGACIVIAARKKSKK